MVAALADHSRFEVPRNVVRDIRDLHGRYGRLRLEPGEDGTLALYASEETLLDQVAASPLTRDLVGERRNGSLPVEREHRGEIKRALIKARLARRGSRRLRGRGAAQGGAAPRVGRRPTLRAATLARLTQEDAVRILPSTTVRSRVAAA